MKKVLVLLIYLATISTLPARSQGKDLHGLLLSYMQMEDLHPDSLERNIADLKQHRLQSQDPAQRAVYAASIARMYSERIAWRSVGGNLRDSMVSWYAVALADKQILARTKAKKWKPFVTTGKDESYFRGDMLNVVWHSMVEDVDKRVRDTSSVLPRYADMVAFYRQQGMRSAALLLAIDSLFDSNNTPADADFLKLRDEYADQPLCAELYLHLASNGNKSVFKKREWLQQGLQEYPKYKRKRALQNALNELSDPTFTWSGPSYVYPGKEYMWRFSGRNLRAVSIDGKEHAFAYHDPIETFRDSMLWTAPGPGEYTLTFVPQPRVKTERKVEPLIQRLCISALQMVYQSMPGNRVRVLVVDSETGQPRPGVSVTAFRPDRRDTVEYFTGHTDQRGSLVVPQWKAEGSNRFSSQMRLQLCTAEEQHLPIHRFYLFSNSEWKGAPKDSAFHMQLFADRSMYRPGQTIHVSGITYRQLDWVSHVCESEQFVLELVDVNGKVVERKPVESDEMGVFCADFEIPSGGKNGQFCVRVQGKASAYFRVEEYKRPTFEVTFDDSLNIVGDSCLVSGKAMTYDGTPLRGARVTGTYRWQTPWIYYAKRFPQQETVSLDSLETDDKGRFSYWLPVPQQEPLRRQNLFVSVDVLSQQGETHNAQHFYRQWHEPVLQPEPVKVDSTFLVVCEADTFAVDRPGRITVTTNLEDVYLYYTLSAAGQVWKDEMVTLSNETFTLDIPYREEYDQSLTASFCFVRQGKVYAASKTLFLAQSENRLQVRWDTFRDLLQPGQQEEWRLTLSRPDGSPASANLMVALYDASLDYFEQHRWNFNVYRSHRTFSSPFNSVSRPQGDSSAHGWYPQKRKATPTLVFTQIDGEQFRIGAYTRGTLDGQMYRKAMGAGPLLMAAAKPAYKAMANTEESYDGLELEDEALNGRIAGLDIAQTSSQESTDEEGENDLPVSVPMRENFSETAFFYPQLRTDGQGRITISFTLPESLTRWNLLGVAHTSDLMYANLYRQVEARKDLMAQLYLPRFLRPGDEAVLTATVRNISDTLQQGRGVMQILDAQTEKVLGKWKTDVCLEGQRDTVFHFPYAATNGDIIVRWAVEGTTCSDGEQRLLPVLPATVHVTNTVALTAYDPSVQRTDLSAIFPSESTERRLTVEYTTHPEQLALQTLPFLASAQRRDVLSLAAAYYAGVIGKALNVEMADSTQVYLERMTELQDVDGGFRWYPSMPANTYLTREVSYLLTRLKMLTKEAHAEQVNAKAVHYLLRQPIDSAYLSTSDLRTLYVTLYSGVSLSKEESKKVDFLLRLAKREDVEEDGYERQALLTLVLKQAGADRKAQKCAKAFRKYIVTSPDRGAYIEFPKGSFSSIDRKLHIHVQLMEALQRMNAQDTLLTGMRRYLLQQKRTQEWSTPINSANAIFALLYRSGRSMGEGKLKDILTLKRNGMPSYNIMAREDSLGYVRDSVEVGDASAKGQPVELRLQKFSKGESWGSVYADFEQPFNQVDSRGEGLLVRQEYPDKVHTGSRYTVRYYITADRDYEYVTLVAPRPAFTEPVNQRSAYGWSGHSTPGWSGSLAYYRQVHDCTTEFSFCQIPRGEYLIEETLYVERDGSYHSGVAVVRCEYADEFQGHSADCVVRVAH